MERVVAHEIEADPTVFPRRVVLKIATVDEKLERRTYELEFEPHNAHRLSDDLLRGAANVAPRAAGFGG